MALLRVQLFGGLGLAYDDAALTTINTPRMQSLLAYLILNREAPQPRRHVAFLLWPDSSEAQALTNLRHVLHLLRHALPNADRFVQMDAHSIRWHPEAPAEIDVATLEAARAPAAPAADLRRAVDLYHGELLPSCYDDWIVAHRDRLHAGFIELAGRLCQVLETDRDYAGAIHYARRLLQADPLEEESYRLLMRLHALNDDRAAALHVYHTCLSVLRRELDVEPSTATRQLYERLLNLEHAPAPATPSRPPLAGRAPEWEQLQAEWRAAARGPRLIVLSGEPGIGKTRLAEELADWAGRQGLLTARAACYAAGRALAYTPVVDWLRGLPLPALADVWLAEVARLLPEVAEQYPHLPAPGPLTEDWQRRRLFEALGRAVHSSGRPVLLVLDDIQWCDPGTIEFLSYLLHLHHAAQLLVVATLRSNEPAGDGALATLATGLRHEDRWAEIALAPLSAAETVELAAGVLGRPLAPALGLALYGGSEGNPLFVVEMVRAGIARGWPAALDPGHGAAQPGLDLPDKVRRVILARLAQLSPAAGELIGLAAVVGRQFTFALLREASGASEEVLVPALDELWRRRIVRELGAGSYDFSHDRLREVAYGTLSQARRRLLHRQVALALELIHGGDLDPVSAQVADHFEQADLLDQAAVYLQRAAGAARRLLDMKDAVGLIRRAIGMADSLSPAMQLALLPKLYEDLADLLALSGSHEEARQAFAQAAQALAPCAETCADRARLWRKTANSYIDQLRYEEADRALAHAGEELGPPPADEAAAAVAWWREWVDVRLDRMTWHYWQAEWHAAASLAAEVRPVLERHGSARQQARYYTELVRIGLRRDRYNVSDEMLGWSNTARAILQNRQGEPEIDDEFSYGFALLWYGDLTAAHSILEHALTMSQRVGDTLRRLRCAAYLSIWARLVDRPAEVERYVQSCLALVSRVNSPYYRFVARANRAWLAWRAGHLDDAQGEACAALDLLNLPAPSFPFQWLAYWTLMDIALSRGDPAEAAAHARRILDADQQRQSAAIIAALEQAVAIVDLQGAPAAGEALAAAVQLARDRHFL